MSATMHGARRSFLIVGLAQSPEFLYTTAPGELVPDDSRFGVIWMSRSAMEAAYDLDGAFNDALLAVARPENLPAVLAATDRILDEYGGLGAYGLEDQFSNRFVMEEISGLRASAAAVPTYFPRSSGFSAQHRVLAFVASGAPADRPDKGFRLYRSRSDLALFQADPDHHRRRSRTWMSGRPRRRRKHGRAVCPVLQVSIPCFRDRSVQFRNCSGCQCRCGGGRRPVRVSGRFSRFHLRSL